ncbi:MAG: hypothetical protein LBD40_00340 [Puniceicoccales bacterium]|nr:hypothetical protein [Puniceicoccales bacterium]
MQDEGVQDEDVLPWLSFGLMSIAANHHLDQMTDAGPTSSLPSHYSKHNMISSSIVSISYLSFRR